MMHFKLVEETLEIVWRYKKGEQNNINTNTNTDGRYISTIFHSANMKPKAYLVLAVSFWVCEVAKVPPIHTFPTRVSVSF